MNFEHRTVLLAEAVEALHVVPDGIYVDGTFGRGGHSRAILQQLGPAGRLLVLDRDPQAYAAARELAAADARCEAVQADFAQLATLVQARGWVGRVNGVLLDLGVSSPQIDDAQRGFSFMREGPLDMRMNPQAGVSAAEFLGTATVEELTTVFRDLGEERHARRIAQAIVRARDDGRRLTTTRGLAELVAAVVPARDQGKNPATRVFQALRIHVNDELGQLTRVLVGMIELLAPLGRIAVISFHSLEDRIVKRFFLYHSKGPELPRGLPVEAVPGPLALVGKAIFPSDEEVAANPRARSAVLRVAERRAEVARG